jgi:inner membrane protein
MLRLAMLKTSHALIGAATGAVTASLMSRQPLAGAAIGAVAGLLPDVDHPEATIGKLLPAWWHRLTPGHRGPTHTLWWCALVGVLAHLLANWVAAPLHGAPASPLWGMVTFTGSLSHVLADGLTTEGIPLLWPFSRHRLRLLGWASFPTGSLREQLVTAVIVLVGVWVTWGPVGTWL